MMDNYRSSLLKATLFVQLCLTYHGGWSVSAFTLVDRIHLQSNTFRRPRTSSLLVLNEVCNNDHSNNHHDPTHSETKKIGDSLRDATGIRPSLHPTTINALASALKIRATHLQGDQSLTISDQVSALEVAVRAGRIAMDAIAQRQSKSDQDGMTLTPEEVQTIAGRVVGVVVRLDDLEATLVQKVQATSWIAKYGDWDGFGVLSDESEPETVRQRIKDDPLFAMTRAECLLGIFLTTVEAPQLAQAGQSVPDQGQVDFLDEDRKDVLL